MSRFHNRCSLSWYFHVLPLEHVVVVFVDDGSHVVPVDWIQGIVQVVLCFVEAVESQCTVGGGSLEGEESFVDVCTDMVVCLAVLVPGNQQRDRVVW